ncbi:MAG: TolC family protein [Bacteroidetes bacterium]|nr:TolC family protein [Bacteroidota bacterium]MBS1941080.1 TolC family protein [Bacteroidota bacterium]
MRHSTTAACILLAGALAAQGPVSLSLQQAMDMAATQSYAVQASQLEADKAVAKIKEVTAIGLPQINATGSVSNYIKVPTMVIPNFFGNDPKFIEMQFGLPWTMSGGVQLNQLIFDGSYLVGLQATHELRNQSEKQLEQAQLDARVQAAKAYLGVLAAEEGVRLIGEGLPVVQKAANDASAMVQEGMMGTTDADRLTVQVDETQDQQRSLRQQATVARAYLALVLGLPAGTPITLTDSLQPLLDDAASQDLANVQFDPAKHVEEEAAQSTLRLSELDLKNKKSAYLPKLSGFINYQQQFNYTEFKPSDGTFWFPSSMWGLQLNVPIFSSGMRSRQVQQAKLSMDQAQVNLKATEQRLLTDRLQQQAVLTSAQESYTTGKASLALSKRIFEQTSTKFSEGMASSFELTQEHGNYLTAQQTYIQRMVDLLKARVDMRKALDLF